MIKIRAVMVLILKPKVWFPPTTATKMVVLYSKILVLAVNSVRLKGYYWAWRRLYSTLKRQVLETVFIFSVTVREQLTYL